MSFVRNSVLRPSCSLYIIRCVTSQVGFMSEPRRKSKCCPFSSTCKNPSENPPAPANISIKVAMIMIRASKVMFFMINGLFRASRLRSTPVGAKPTSTGRCAPHNPENIRNPRGPCPTSCSCFSASQSHIPTYWKLDVGNDF